MTKKLQFRTFESSLGWRLTKEFNGYLTACFIDYASQPIEMQHPSDRLSVAVLHEAIEQEEILEPQTVYFRQSQVLALCHLFAYTRTLQLRDTTTDENFLLLEGMYEDIQGYFKSISSPITSTEEL